MVILRLAEGKGAVILRPGEIHEKEADEKAKRLTTIAFTTATMLDSEEDLERSQSPTSTVIEKDDAAGC